MSETKRSAEVSLKVEGDAETASRADEALQDMEAAGASSAGAATSLEAFVSKATNLARKFEEL